MALSTSPVVSDATRLLSLRTALEDRQIPTAAELFAALGKETQKEAFDLLCAKFRDKCTYGDVVRDGVELVFDDLLRLLVPVDGVTNYDYSKEGKRGKAYHPRIIDCLLYQYTHVRVTLPAAPGDERTPFERGSDRGVLDTFCKIFREQPRSSTFKKEVAAVYELFSAAARKQIEKKLETSKDIEDPQKLQSAVYAYFNNTKYSSAQPTSTIPSSQQKSPNDYLIDFYGETGPNSDRVYLKHILEHWDDDRLEKDENYIHWLFPGMGNKGNENAPALASAPEIVKLFQKDDFYRHNLSLAFDRMLRFYGFEYRQDGSGVLYRTPGHELKWLNGQHHFKRITRILGCLKNLGREAEAKRFLAVLVVVARNEGKGKIPEESLESWGNAVYSSI